MGEQDPRSRFGWLPALALRDRAAPNPKGRSGGATIPPESEHPCRCTLTHHDALDQARHLRARPTQQQPQQQPQRRQQQQQQQQQQQRTERQFSAPRPLPCLRRAGCAAPTCGGYLLIELLQLHSPSWPQRARSGCARLPRASRRPAWRLACAWGQCAASERNLSAPPAAVHVAARTQALTPRTSAYARCPGFRRHNCPMPALAPGDGDGGTASADRTGRQRLARIHLLLAPGLCEPGVAAPVQRLHVTAVVQQHLLTVRDRRVVLAEREAAVGAV